MLLPSNKDWIDRQEGRILPDGVVHQRVAIHVSADDSGRGRSDVDDDDDVCEDAGPGDEGDRHEDLVATSNSIEQFIT